MGVNFHAIEEYVRRHGGLAMSTTDYNLSLHTNIAVFSSKSKPFQAAALNYVFQEQVDFANPIQILSKSMNYFTQETIPITENTLSMLLALFRLSHYDNTQMSYHIEKLSYMDNFDEYESLEVETVLDKMRVNTYSLNTLDQNFGFLAILYRRINKIEKAIDTLKDGIELFGPHHGWLEFLALCYSDLKDYPNAIEAAKRCITAIQNMENLPEETEKALVKPLRQKIERWQKLVSPKSTTSTAVAKKAPEVTTKPLPKKKATNPKKKPTRRK